MTSDPHLLVISHHEGDTEESIADRVNEIIEGLVNEGELPKDCSYAVQFSHFDFTCPSMKSKDMKDCMCRVLNAKIIEIRDEITEQHHLQRVVKGEAKMRDFGLKE